MTEPTAHGWLDDAELERRAAQARTCGVADAAATTDADQCDALGPFIGVRNALLIEAVAIAAALLLIHWTAQP